MVRELSSIIINYFYYYPKKEVEDCYRFLFRLKLDNPKEMLLRKEEFLTLIKNNRRAITSSEIDPDFKRKYLGLDLNKNHSSRPELPAQKNKVIVRFSPNPNFPPTLGNLCGWVLNRHFYNLGGPGSQIYLRLDDSDPKNKPATTQAITEYLSMVNDYEPGVKVVSCSERLPLYYEKARKYLREGLLEIEGYTGSSESQELDLLISGTSTFSKIRVRGHMREGRPIYCLRVILPQDQVRKEKEGRCLFPTLLFQTTIDDQDLNITHAIRGKDLRPLSKRQVQLSTILGIKPPQFKYWGRIKILDRGILTKPSSSAYAKKAALNQGKEYYQLDQVYSYRYFLEKGYSPQVLESFILSYGFTENDITLELSRLDAFRKKTNKLGGKR